MGRRVSNRLLAVELPLLRKLKLLLLLGVVAGVYSYFFLGWGNAKQQAIVPTQEHHPAVPNSTAQPIFTATQLLLPVGFDLHDEQDEASHEQSIKWLIEASMKEDERIDRAAVLQREILIDHIKEDHDKFGTDLESLMRHNQIFPIADLNVLRHRKFTSPTITRNGILNIIRSIFSSDPFDNVERILDPRNDNSWRSDGNRITVFSSTNISPYYLRIKMAADADNQRISLFGLRIQQDKLAVVKTFTSYFLGWFDLAECDRDGWGARYLPCVAPNCASGYTFLMLLMEKVAVVQLEVFGRRTI